MPRAQANDGSDASQSKTLESCFADTRISSNSFVLVSSCWNLLVIPRTSPYIRRSMFVLPTIVCNLLLGARALSIIRTSELTTNLEDIDNITCMGANAEDCDIKAQARGNLTAQNPVRPFFVKFHKVGSTTLMELLNAFMCVSVDCGRSCGECKCSGGATACTGHISKDVLVDYVLAAEQPAHNLFTSEKVSVNSQLIPMKERRTLFTKLSGMDMGDGVVQYSGRHAAFNLKHVPLSWVPKKHDEDSVAFITLLRNPLERIRSKYSFRRAENFCGENCLAKQSSFMDWMEHSGLDVCCEYVTTLGRGSVTKAKKVLATMFDLVGITEEMDDAYVDAAKLFGVPVDHLPTSITCRGNAESKKDWSSKELKYAKKIAADDIEIYNFARDLKKKRRLIA